MDGEKKTYDFSNLDPNEVANKVGDLYGSLGDDATELLADHLPAMQETQDYVSALAGYAIAQTNELLKLQQKNADLKEANVKMMMEKIKREPTKTEDETAMDDLNDALDNIDI